MRRLICWLGLTGALAAAAPLTAAGGFQDPVALPGGVTDAAGKVGYLSKPKGGIVAIDLAKGDVLWESKRASRPLIVAGKRLAALAVVAGGNRLACHILVLDTQAKGKQLLKSDPIALPAWAEVGTGRDRPERFHARSQLAKDTLVLRWWAETWSGGGAFPARRANYAAGVARINLATGKVGMRRDDKLEAPAGDGLVEVEKLPKDIQEVARGAGWRAGIVLGPRVYGAVRKPAQKAFGDFREFVQAVELKTAKRLWERPYDAYHVYAPPP